MTKSESSFRSNDKEEYSLIPEIAIVVPALRYALNQNPDKTEYQKLSDVESIVTHK